MKNSSKCSGRTRTPSTAKGQGSTCLSLATGVKAWVMNAILSLEQFVSGQMQSTVELALRSGLSAEKVIELQGRALQPALDTALPAAARAGFASATEGFWALTRTEGGCISVEEARALLGGVSGFTRQAVHDRIKKKQAHRGENSVRSIRHRTLAVCGRRDSAEWNSRSFARFARRRRPLFTALRLRVLPPTRALARQRNSFARTESG